MALFQDDFETREPGEPLEQEDIFDVPGKSTKGDLMMLLNNTYPVRGRGERTDLFRARFEQLINDNVENYEITLNLKSFLQANIGQISIHFLCLESPKITHTETMRYLTPVEKRAWFMELTAILEGSPLKNYDVEFAEG